jgi:hypothetical protein
MDGFGIGPDCINLINQYKEEIEHEEHKVNFVIILNELKECIFQKLYMAVVNRLLEEGELY